ncbi:flagellar basal body-associated protein FliL [Shewanella youngdeokensis]|uniref:Flagellar protein FliL n=1 Tax=Shewanella youngdeokensis TaxID=2999068 RepID=A0ABZ0JYS1_9GAMM|nr:flagellar basal body-associated protein FliL [Shewanella sp. DAU334]
MKTIIAILLFTLSSFAVCAEGDKPREEYAYYGFEPDIVTNYISNQNKLGYVKISVELMVTNPEDLLSLEKHDPLLRSAIVEILGNQTENKVKSLTGKEEIRRECFEMINRLLVEETGKELVFNLLFTKYLYD